MLQADNQPGWQVQPASVQAVPGAGCEDREAGGSVKIWYNSDCQDEQNTGALCFPSAAMFSQSDIVGKAFLICGLTSQAVHLDNGSAYKERFVMAVIRCIYLIQNIINKHCYVGQTVNFDHRRGEHLSTLRHKKHKNPYLQNAFNLYGEKYFRFSILEEVSEGDGITFREQYWIERLKPEYNIELNVFDHARHKREHDKKYKVHEETFERPAWHAKVYGGCRK